VDARPDRGPASQDEDQAAPKRSVESAGSSEDDSYRKRVKSFIQELQDRITPDKPRDWGFFDVMMLSIETMQSSMIRMKMAPYTPDHYLAISRDVARAHEFHRARELIQLGRDTAERFLPH
jgi:NTE family protein